MTTTCATSVLDVCGWTLAPSTAHPRVGSTRAPFILGLCSAVSGCVAHYHTIGAAPEPQHTPSRACREGAGQPHGLYPPHTDPRTPHRVTRLSRERSLHPCMLLTMRRGPRTRHPEPQARRVRARGAYAERGQAHCMARGDCPRSQGRHVASCFAPLHGVHFVLFFFCDCSFF
jgi:hypothetical protein